MGLCVRREPHRVERPGPLGLCSARHSWRVEAAQGQAQVTLSELTPQQVPGSRGPQGSGKDSTKRLPLLSHPLGWGPLHTSALGGTSPGWGREHKWKVLLLRVADTMAAGRPAHLAPFLQVGRPRLGSRRTQL